MYKIPVAQRFPRGCTFIFETLFRSSVKSKLTDVLKDMLKSIMRANNRLYLQCPSSVLKAIFSSNCRWIPRLRFTWSRALADVLLQAVFMGRDGKRL